jgi:superfamily II DNA or RNA helicase
MSEYPLIIRNVIRLTDKVVSIPSGREDLIPAGYEIIDKRSCPTTLITELKATLRPAQAEAVNTIVNSGLVNAPVGYGKTLVGLALAHKFQTKTLIITTTTTIRDMWIAEVKKFFGFEPGVIGSGKVKTDSPIVVSNIQTLSRRLGPELNSMFGLVVVDEVHRSPANTFTKTLNALRAKHKVGLSGTLERKDGMHCVLQDYFGFDKFVGVVENVMNPTVHLYTTSMPLQANEFIPWANIVSKLVADPEYLAIVGNLTRHYVSLGHKVLVLSDRTALLETLHLEMPEDSLIITGKISKSEDRQRIMKTVSDHERGLALFATQSIFSEGVSLNELSCVILGAPINNDPLLEQICGRVMRNAEGKLEPVIVDIGFSGGTGIKHRNNRTAVYINKGWKLRNMSLISGGS